MIFYILLFFFDFFMFVFLEKWVFFTLLTYFIFCQNKLKDRYSIKCFYVPIFLILMQDFFINDKLGLGLIYVAFLILFVPKFKSIFKVHICLLGAFLLICMIIMQDFVIKRCIIGQNIVIYSTITKIFINIIIGYLVLLGTRGNRSFFYKKGGKSGLQTGRMPYKKFFK